MSYQINDLMLILGEPIETDVGKLHHLTVSDYIKFSTEIQLLSMSKLEIIYQFQMDNKQGTHDKLIKVLDKSSLWDIVQILPDFTEAYEIIFAKVFTDEDVMEKISEENFYDIREQIMRMNVIKEEPINPNPEIQKAWDRSKRVKAEMAEKVTVEDMITSVSVFADRPYDMIRGMTVYQFMMDYQRIAAAFDYQTAILFSTVSTDKIKIESWSRHIDLFQQDKHELDEATANRIKQAF